MPPKSKTPVYMRRCVASLVEDGYDTNAAFAICNSTMQKAGYLTAGPNQRETQKGRRRKRQMAAEAITPSRDYVYEEALEMARRNPKQNKIKVFDAIKGGLIEVDKNKERYLSRVEYDDDGYPIRAFAKKVLAKDIPEFEMSYEFSYHARRDAQQYIDDYARTTLIAYRNRDYFENPSHARQNGSMAEYGALDAIGGLPPTKIGQGNREYMKAYNEILAFRGEKPLPIKKPPQAYLDALHSGRRTNPDHASASWMSEREYDNLKKGERVEVDFRGGMSSGKVILEAGRTSYSKKYDVYSKKLYYIDKNTNKPITKGSVVFTLYKRMSYRGQEFDKPRISLAKGDMGVQVNSLRKLRKNPGHAGFKDPFHRRDIGGVIVYSVDVPVKGGEYAATIVKRKGKGYVYRFSVVFYPKGASTGTIVAQGTENTLAKAKAVVMRSSWARDAMGTDRRRNPGDLERMKKLRSRAARMGLSAKGTNKLEERRLQREADLEEELAEMEYRASLTEAEKRALFLESAKKRKNPGHLPPELEKFAFFPGEDAAPMTETNEDRLSRRVFGKSLPRYADLNHLLVDSSKAKGFRLKFLFPKIKRYSGRDLYEDNLEERGKAYIYAGNVSKRSATALGKRIQRDLKSVRNISSSAPDLKYYTFAIGYGKDGIVYLDPKARYNPGHARHNPITISDSDVLAHQAWHQMKYRDQIEELEAQGGIRPADARNMRSKLTEYIDLLDIVDPDGANKANNNVYQTQIAYERMKARKAARKNPKRKPSKAINDRAQLVKQAFALREKTGSRIKPQTIMKDPAACIRRMKGSKK